MSARLARMLPAARKSGRGTHTLEQYSRVVVEGRWNHEVVCDDAALEIPLRVCKPTRWFVDSMSDLFHEGVPGEFVMRVFRAMERCPQHTFLVLTKRPDRMVNVLGGSSGAGLQPECTLPNVWLGTSCEDQQRADERLPELAKLHAAGWHTFVSFEPLLERIKLSQQQRAAFEWAILGGESGAGARPCDMAWIGYLLTQLQINGVAAYVKQVGARPLHLGFEFPVNHPKGGDTAEWPADLRVREWPAGMEATS